MANLHARNGESFRRKHKKGERFPVANRAYFNLKRAMREVRMYFLEQKKDPSLRSRYGWRWFTSRRDPHGN